MECTVSFKSLGCLRQALSWSPGTLARAWAGHNSAFIAIIVNNRLAQGWEYSLALIVNAHNFASFLFDVVSV